MRVKSVVFFITLLLCMCLFPLAATQAAPIDLNTFTPDPSSAVSIAADGSSATIVEDPGLSSILLYNDSIHIPSNAASLSFDYDFILGAGNADELNAYLYDSGFAHLTDSWIGATGTGTVTWNLAGASFLGSDVGLEFDLNSLDSLSDSAVTVSNVRIDTVPVPCALLLFGSGLAGLLGLRRKSFRKLP